MSATRWLRLRPSGHVHYLLVIIKEFGAPRALAACDRWLTLNQLTDDYPPLATRCPECLRITDRLEHPTEEPP